MSTPDTNTNHSSVAPYLFYDDVDKAVRFLEAAFGFKRVFVSPSPEGGLAHAQLVHGAQRIMLGKVGPGLRPVQSAASLPALHAGIYVYVDSADRHHTHARAHGAQVLLEPADQPWGDRMYCALDPEGQFWMFATRTTT
ncbi:MAG: VOC family protein [Myxococcales bacterium]|nr:VOC family protein [Myxococcales bacterium]